MNPHGKTLKAFLKSMHVEVEDATGASHANLAQVSFLQRSRERDVLYKLDLLGTIPQLRIIVPADDTMLTIHMYLVQLSEQHPLADLFDLFSTRGGDEFERDREFSAGQLLHALGEMMKSLFWAGYDSCTFAPEIMVERLL